jgi:hypothetical protein
MSQQPDRRDQPAQYGRPPHALPPGSYPPPRPGQWQYPPAIPPQQYWGQPPVVPVHVPVPVPEQARTAIGLCSSALGLSIAGLFIFGLVLGLAGLICGIIGVNLAKERDGRGRGQAIAAIPIGAIAALVHVFMLASL